MPMVNGKEYAYTAKGMKAAKMEAMKSGKKMVKKTAKKKTMKKTAKKAMPKSRGLFGGM
jgi:hypothetical protein